MAKITSKYQVTVPKRIAEAHDLRPGDDIEWVTAGEVIRVIPPGKQEVRESREQQLRLFDKATRRHSRRRRAGEQPRPRHRGWTREDLYQRGRTR